MPYSEWARAATHTAILCTTKSVTGFNFFAPCYNNNLFFSSLFFNFCHHHVNIRCVSRLATQLYSFQERRYSILNEDGFSESLLLLLLLFSIASRRMDPDHCCPCYSYHSSSSASSSASSGASPETYNTVLFDCSVFCVSCSVFRVPCSVFCVPCSVWE